MLASLGCNSRHWLRRVIRACWPGAYEPLRHTVRRAITADRRSPLSDGAGIMRFVRTAGILGLVALAGLTASCDTSHTKVSGAANASSTTITTSKLRVGETTQNAVLETVRFYAENVLGTSFTDLPSTRAVASIRVCATPKLQGTASVQASDFEATLTNGETLTGSTDATFPGPLRPSALAGSECTTGIVTWDLPDDKHARTITDSKRRVDWAVSCPAAPRACLAPSRLGVASPAPHTTTTP